MSLYSRSSSADVRTLTRKLEVKIPGWPADKLLVYGEHSSIFQDLITEPLLEQVSHCLHPVTLKPQLCI